MRRVERKKQNAYALIGQAIQQAMIHRECRRNEMEHQMAHGTQSVKDPVCGMGVDPGTAAVTRTHEGMTYYFCSAGCAKQFDADPHRYAHKRESGHSS